MNFLDIVSKFPKKVFLLRLKTASERIVSLFSKQHLECIGLCYEDPIYNKTQISIMNAFGLIIPHFSQIPLDLFLKSKILEEIQVFEINYETSIKILEHFVDGKEISPELWVKRLCNRYWSKNKNAFLSILKLLEGKECEGKYISKKTKNRLTGKPEDKLKEKGKPEGDENSLFQKDIEFLKEVWPTVSQKLMENEFRFQLAIASEDNLIQYVAKGIETGEVQYEKLREQTKYKDFLPPLEKNKAVVFKTEPCKNLDEICEEFFIFMSTIQHSLENRKPIEIHYNLLLANVNHLFQSCGKEEIKNSFEGEVLSNLICKKEKPEKFILREGKEIRFFNYQSEIPNFERETLEEILRFIDGIARPENPYEFIRSCIVEKLANS